MSNKRKVISKQAVVSPNGSIIGSNNVIYNDYNAVDDLYTSLCEYFTTGNVSGTSHLSNIIKKDFDSINKSKATSLNTIKDLMSITKEVGEYINNKKNGDKDYMRWLLRKQLLRWQIPVFDDTNKRISLMCGRRSGKSYLCAALLLSHAIIGRDNIETDNGVVSKPRDAMFIGLTMTKAVDVIWQPLRDLIQICKIPVNRIDNSGYVISLSNGASIRLSGNGSKAEREKIRGKDCSMFIIDEMQSQSGVLYLLESIISPILAGRNGTLVCSGTAPLVGGTYWEHIQSDNSWSHYSATMKDNDTIKDAELVLQQVLETNGWTADNVVFRREYLGEIAHDTEKLVIKSKTYYDNESKYTAAVLGIDFGYTDNSSWVLLGKHNDTYDVIYEYTAKQMSSSEIENKTLEALNIAVDKYNIPKNEVYIIGDSSHQMFLREMYMQGWNNVEIPYKLNESQQWQDLSTAMSTGHIRIKKDSRIDRDSDILSWSVDKETGYTVYVIDDKLNHELQVSDVCDALKYASFYALNTL